LIFDNSITSTKNIVNELASTTTILSASLITSILFLASLSIFLWLAIRSKSIKSFQSQISIFISIYIVGELLEIVSSSNSIIPIFPKIPLPQEIGSQIHVGATILLTLILWMRFYYFNKSMKELVMDTGIKENNSSNNNSNESQNE
jgi:hypothetical protein